MLLGQEVNDAYLRYMKIVGNFEYHYIPLLPLILGKHVIAETIAKGQMRLG
jgi:hypothetical protein